MPRLFLRFPAGFLALSLAAAHAQSAPDQIPTLHASSRLVLVDVVVTDRQGHPIHDLKQSDFTLLENKSPQLIGSFSETIFAAAAAREPRKLPPGVYTNYAPPEVTGPVNVLLLDTLNTPIQDQQTVRQQLLDYLNRSKPGTRIAIFGLTTQLLLLQDLTSDPELLKQVVLKQRGKRSPALTNQVSGNDLQMPLSEKMLDDGQTTGSVIQAVAAFEAEQQSLQQQIRAKLTLQAMNALGRYLAGIPGRKNLIWLSGSFPIEIAPDTTHTSAALAASSRSLPSGGGKTGASAFQGQADVEQEFRETIDLLSRSQVAVYPIQVHGLSAAPMLSADNGSTNAGLKYTRNPSAYANDQTNAFLQTASGDHTMLELADQTGGQALVLGNGLAEAVRKAVENGSDYYTLGYTPTGKWQGDYRDLQVKLAGKSYVLSYRRGYYADDPDPPHRAVGQRPEAATLKLAMQFAAPPATQLLMRVQAQPASVSDGPSTPAPGDKPMADPKQPGTLYRRYMVNFSADPAGIAFETLPGGARRATVEFVTAVYRPTGELANTKYQNVTANLTAAQYASALTDGLNYRQEVAVPVGGKYLLRVAVHDVASDRIGAVTFPVDTSEPPK